LPSSPRARRRRGTAIQESEYRLADLRQSAQKFQGEVERLLERREQMGAQIRELTEEDLRLAEEIRSLSERRTELTLKREDAIRALGEAGSASRDWIIR
jgi:DNA repair ATPase RecN